MSDRDRINKVLKALRDGTDAVRYNPSEYNYRRAERELEKAGQKPNFWRWVIGVSLSGVAALFVMSTLSPSQRDYPQQTNISYYFKFPMSACGDKTAGGTNTWYPVYINYTKDNLIIIRQNFCRDAFYDSSVDRIQVASFYNRSIAYQLVAELKARNFKSTKVGNGHVVTTSPCSSQNNCP